jgi:ankyrin repeat protein
LAGLALALALSTPPVGGQDFALIRQFGAEEGGFATSVVVDSAGIYVVGMTKSALPGQTRAGGFDAFVFKSDTSGKQLWTRQFGTAEDDAAIRVAANGSWICVVGDTGAGLSGQTGAWDIDAFLVGLGDTHREIGIPKTEKAHGSDSEEGWSSHSAASQSGLLPDVGVRTVLANDDPIFGAVKSGDLETVRAYLSKGGAVDARDADGMTLMFHAAAMGHQNIVELLLSKGASINATEKHGCKPLHTAAWKGRLEIVSLLLERGAGVNDQGCAGASPLWMAASAGHRPVVEVLLSKGADINVMDKGGYTPLHEASSAGHIDVVRYLLSKGANPEVHAKDKLGLTPLHFAALRGRTEIVRLLLSNGVPPNIRSNDERGWTPLHLAAVANQRDVCAVLLAKGADPDTAGRDGVTPLGVAERMGWTELAQLLKESRK